ncbi:MAG: DUF480 domain-containing protein [Planctomycetaceae bacterium]
MDPSPSPASRVRPLDSIERRVLGVLIEKAKTTPDAYPMSLAAIVTGCNQKSNRDPLMSLDEEQVARAMETLRESGAAAEIFGSGRVPRYRHLAYEWFGDVTKEDLAILAELLLRGEQSEGDLRGRASRMDPIADLTLLRTRLDILAARGLVEWLSPPGRGRMLTHGLLPPEKLEKVRAQVAAAGHASAAPPPDDDAPARPARPASPTGVDETTALAPLLERIAGLERDLAALGARLERLEKALGD